MKPEKMATGNISEVVNMYQTLVKDWNKKPVNLEKCGKLLSSLKVSEDLMLFLIELPLIKSTLLWMSKEILHDFFLISV